MKNAQKQISLLVAGLTLSLVSSSSQACQKLGVGDLAVNSDCQAQMAEIFTNQAVAPALADVADRMLKEHLFYNIDEGYPQTISFLYGEYWSMDGSIKSPAGLDGVIQREDDELRDARLIRVDPTAITSTQRGIVYAVRKWGHYLISWYGTNGEYIANKYKDVNAFGFTDLSDADDQFYSSQLSYDDSLKALSGSDQVLKANAIFSLISNPTWTRTAILPMLDAVRDQTNYVWARSAALKALLGLNDARVNTIAEMMYSDVATPIELKARILKSAQYSGIENSVGLAISRGLLDSSSLFIAALARAEVDKMKAAVLPLVDILKNSNAALASLRIPVIQGLGIIGSARALPVLKDDLYYNSSDVPLREASRLAVSKIEAQVNIAMIPSGDSSAIQWSQQIIGYNDGSARPLVDQILTQYKSKRIPATVRGQLATYLKAEIASGYHDYDQTLIQEMKTTLRALQTP